MRNGIIFSVLFSVLPLTIQAQQSGMALPFGEQLLTDVCMTCHGTYGQGNPVVGAPRLAGMESWYLKKQLESFRSAWRGMEKDYIPAYEMRDTAMALTDSDIEQLAVMLSSWQAAPATDTLSGDVSHGQEIYQQCMACHGVTAEGNALLSAPALAYQNDWYLLGQLKLFKSGYRGSHPDDETGARMQTIMTVLETEQDMLDVLAYINSID